MTASFTMYVARCRGEKLNAYYPNKVVVNSVDDFRYAVSHDYVLAEYNHNHRSNSDFIVSDALAMDCDNTHSDDPDKWLTPEKVSQLLPDVPFYVHYSRNNMKPKGKHPPAQRAHYIFPISPEKDFEKYAELKMDLLLMFPELDEGAKDAARFFFGTDNPKVEYYPGNTLLDKYLSQFNLANLAPVPNETIPEGSRNSTMHTIGVKLIKRYGDTPEAYNKFIDENKHCNPPLDDNELNTIWKSCKGFFKDKIVKNNYIQPEEYSKSTEHKWDQPIPLDSVNLPVFPVNSLPEPMKKYVLAVSESTQTPVDMGACGVLTTAALCIQKKYVIKIKSDWTEPLNLYSLIILPPSERKSAVLSADIRPALQYECDYNKIHSADFEASAAKKRVLEKKQHDLEEQIAKGKASMDELDKIVAERSEFRDLSPMRLFVDDVTTEKLISVLAENNGKAAIVSAEGGIFDMLSGIYTKSVNIDAVLKGYSGDCIRVDRIGRQSESIMNPAITMLLMVQPSVLSGLIQNGTFRGRGLTARFLYSIPESKVGSREFTVAEIPNDVYEAYADLIHDLLDDNPPESPEEITLSSEAYSLIERFALELEPKLINEYADISEWAGKLTGNITRIAGILCRASVMQNKIFLYDKEPLVVSKEIMQDAISIGKYFLEHAKAAFSIMGDDINKLCKYLLETVTKEGLTEFTRRDIMRLCRRFKTADELQPVLERLSDYGYIAEKIGAYHGKGRPTAPTYSVNPYLYER